MDAIDMLEYLSMNAMLNIIVGCVCLATVMGVVSLATED